jgi:hypothetical protein
MDFIARFIHSTGPPEVVVGIRERVQGSTDIQYLDIGVNQESNPADPRDVSI